MKRIKKVYRLKPRAKLILGIIIVLIVLFVVISTLNQPQETKYIKPKEIIKKEENATRNEINDVLEQEQEEEMETFQTQNEAQEPIPNTYTTRMTSFWTNDGYGTGDCTGSGLCSWDFQVNDKGWYTYNGKLVVATATVYLANQGWNIGNGVHLYKYWEELILTIDGIDYEAIILDSCGSSMKNDRVDLFVSNGSSAKDTTIQVRRK